MMSRCVLLYSLRHIMLIIEYADGVRYQNQVGGMSCYQAEMEGVLCPLDIDTDGITSFESLPYPQEGISYEIADIIDAILASKPSTCFLKVDRERLNDSCEAWVYVQISSPDTDDSDRPETMPMTSARPAYSGPLHGFGNVRGVLTWDNSD